MFTKTNLSSKERIKLRFSRVEVSKEVFLIVASKYDFEKRKKLVENYGDDPDAIFYSDGSILFMCKHSKRDIFR